jgi:phage baseplate assembly protein V
MAFGEFDVQRLLMPIKNKIMLLIGRCILKAVNNTGTTQTLQVTAMKDETISDIERLQEYGFDSYPKANAEALVIFPNGNRDQGVVIKVHDRDNRPTGLNEGDVVMYDSSGNKLVCRDGSVIEIHGNGGTLEFVLLASLLVAAINTNIVTPYNGHTHGGAVPIPVSQMTAIVEANVVSDKVKVS